MKNQIFTSESVTEGHPDKICDQISDAILDAVLTLDPTAHVACETAVATNLVVVMGEISAKCQIDIETIVRQTILNIGYDQPELGFDGKTCQVIIAIDEQSADINQGVEHLCHAYETDAQHLGAGDQGMMFGYACNETSEYMPLPIVLAHRLCQRLAEVRKTGQLDYLKPDGKSQVSVEYRNGQPQRITSIVLSSQHRADITKAQIEQDLKAFVIQSVIPAHLIDEQTKIYINPTGRFVIGGPHGDSGLTGRKIIVDTYGGRARHGGGAFSGKDPTKVDRSAAYAARWVAKNVVAAGLAQECEIQLAYVIGLNRPVSIYVDTFGTGTMSDEDLAERIQQVFDLSLSSIMQQLELSQPIYLQTATYGHFGRSDLDLPWERLNRVEQLLQFDENPLSR